MSSLAATAVTRELKFPFFDLTLSSGLDTATRWYNLKIEAYVLRTNVGKKIVRTSTKELDDRRRASIKTYTD